MAKEEEKHEEGTEENAEGGKSKKPIIIIAVAIVALIVIGAVVVMMMMKSEDTSGGAEGKSAAKDEHGKKGEKKKGGDEAKPGPMLAIDNIVINLVSETGARYAKVSVALEMDTPESMVEVTERKAMLQDMIITVLSQKTADELITYKGKESCKNEILDKVNEKLHDGTVRNVYFTNFIVQ